MSKRKKITRKIISDPSMEGLKIGLFFPSVETIFVSKAVMKLCESDMELMRKNLTVYSMPIMNGKERFDSVETWIIDLVGRNQDIFTKKAE